MLRKVLIVPAAFVLILVLSGTSHAYIDPGVGGMFYQVILLIIGAIVSYLAVFRQSIKNMFGKKNKEKED